MIASKNWTWGNRMLRTSLPFVYDLAIKMEPLSSLPEVATPARDIIFKVYAAGTAVDSLVDSSLFTPYLRVSRALAIELQTILRRHLQEYDAERDLQPYELFLIRNAYNQYKIALLAELGSLNTYFVTQKGGYDMVSLLMYGENLFPSDLATKVPEALVDVKEATKCLAFEIPTACGFHAFRATESVLRRYHPHVTGGAAPPKVRTLGVYIKSLASSGHGDPKVLAALKQMTDLHRNPIAHPEAVLTTEEAISILGVARSAIGAMLAVLPVIPPTTATLLTAA
jgi:hypothetical protein